MAKRMKHPTETVAPGGSRAWLCRHGYRYTGPCQSPLCATDVIAQREISDGQALIVNLKEMSTTNPCNLHLSRVPGCSFCFPASECVVYIDSSGSTYNDRSWYQDLATKYIQHGWLVYEFSSTIRPWRSGAPMGEGTDVNQAVRHANANHPRALHRHIITDGEIPTRLLLKLDDNDFIIYYTRSQNEFMSVYNTPIRTATQDRTRTSTPVQEAPMSRPTVQTTVSLSASENITLADLKSLIAEVERVGGDDAAEVRLNQQAYRWDVTLSVKANEVEPEPAPLTDDERIALLNEFTATSTTKTRKTEIKALLGL